MGRGQESEVGEGRPQAKGVQWGDRGGCKAGCGVGALPLRPWRGVQVLGRPRCLLSRVRVQLPAPLRVKRLHFSRWNPTETPTTQQSCHLPPGTKTQRAGSQVPKAGQRHEWRKQRSLEPKPLKNSSIQARHICTHIYLVSHTHYKPTQSTSLCAYRPTITCTHVPSHLHMHQNLGGSNTSLSKTISFANPCTCRLLSQLAWG